jgi:hypothetical protein
MILENGYFFSITKLMQQSACVGCFGSTTPGLGSRPFRFDFDGR